VVKVGEGWVEQKLWSFKAGLAKESNILQDSYPTMRMTHPSRLFFVLSFFLYFHVCMGKSAGTGLLNI
jgi:hypothetical protein